MIPHFLKALLRKPLLLLLMALMTLCVMPACSKTTCPAYGGQGDNPSMDGKRKKARSSLWDKRMKNPYGGR